MNKGIFISDSNGIMKKLGKLGELVKVNGEIIMREEDARLQPLKNFEGVREPTKTTEQSFYRLENGIIKDIETQVLHEDSLTSPKKIFLGKSYDSKPSKAKAVGTFA